jgi:hypothetical protein
MLQSKSQWNTQRFQRKNRFDNRKCSRQQHRQLNALYARFIFPKPAGLVVQIERVDVFHPPINTRFIFLLESSQNKSSFSKSGNTFYFHILSPPFLRIINKIFTRSFLHLIYILKEILERLLNFFFH